MTDHAGIRVRGACAAGHVTETTAPKGRVTWRGECSHEGCALPVRARRIPADQVPAPAEDQDDDDGIRTVRIEEWNAPDEPAQPDNATGSGIAVATVSAADLERSTADDRAPAGSPPDPLGEHGERRGALGRLRRRSSRQRAAYRHPLGI